MLETLVSAPLGNVFARELTWTSCWGFNILIDIPNDDTSYLLEGMDKEGKESPHKPKEEPKDATNICDGKFRKRLEVNL